MEMRLAKYLANCGIAARRKCEELIQSGKVTVDGAVVLLPQHMVSGSEKIRVEGKPIQKAPKKLYYIINKPKGYLCTAPRTGMGKSVLDLFEGVKTRLFTVGRLDRDTTGLLIVTNDGDFANKVIHPSSNILKEYVVKTDQEITEEHLKAISGGAYVEKTFVKPKSVKKVRRGTVKIVVAEGKKREVRTLVEEANLQVVELKRTRVGSLLLGNLPIGMWREMKPAEIEMFLGAE